LLLFGFGIFVLILSYIVVASLSRRDAPTFAPRAPRAGGLNASATADTATIDTTDPEQWRFVDLDQGRLLVSPDTAGWDVALRRYHIRASGAIADLRQVELTGLAPTLPGGSVAPGDLDVEPAIDRWYHYSMWSHLLEPNDHVYVLRTSEGHMTKLQVLSYYCPGLQAGCLTIRYEGLGIS
jgi:hypothetical protein